MNPVLVIYSWLATFQEWINKPIKRTTYQFSAANCKKIKERMEAMHKDKVPTMYSFDPDYQVYKRKYAKPRKKRKT